MSSLVGGRVGIEGHDAIGGRAQAVPIQPDLESPEIHVLQHDAVGGDRKLVLLQVDVHVLELVVEGQNVPVDVGG